MGASGKVVKIRRTIFPRNRGHDAPTVIAFLWTLDAPTRARRRDSLGSDTHVSPVALFCEAAKRVYVPGNLSARGWMSNTVAATSDPLRLPPKLLMAKISPTGSNWPPLRTLWPLAQPRLRELPIQVASSSLDRVSATITEPSGWSWSNLSASPRMRADSTRGVQWRIRYVCGRRRAAGARLGAAAPWPPRAYHAGTPRTPVAAR